MEEFLQIHFGSTGDDETPENTDSKKDTSDLHQPQDLVTETMKASSSSTQEKKSKAWWAPIYTRDDLHLGRRFFHFSTGFLVATFYAIFLHHHQLVFVLGISASVLYLLEQIRIHYPELSQHLTFVNKALLRAEEQLKESAAIPYAMALLLTILTFPKIPALIAIYTLAISDPCSAIIGISYGKHKISARKSWEGSLAFFISCFLISFVVLIFHYTNMTMAILKSSFCISFFGMFFEMLPVRIDDNLTIPLFTALNACLFLFYFGIPFF
jgi:dolichol kinase